MLSSAVNKSLQPIHLPINKTRLLLISDSPDRLREMRAGLHQSEFEITGACSVEEVAAACYEDHDVVALDVNPAHVALMLKVIRASATHTMVPVLVEASRINHSFNLAGVLPLYRAMPCSHTEMLTLIRNRYEQSAGELTTRRML
jgi:DNA-binding NtrC family response regulator